MLQDDLLDIKDMFSEIADEWNLSLVPAVYNPDSIGFRQKDIYSVWIDTYVAEDKDQIILDIIPDIFYPFAGHNEQSKKLTNDIELFIHRLELVGYSVSKVTKTSVYGTNYQLKIRS